MVLADVGEDEGTGAVGRLHDARAKAGLTEERRLLVAEDPGDRHAGQFRTTSALTVAKLDSDGWIVASIAGSTSNNVVIVFDQDIVARSINIVRDALDGSVTKAPSSAPPESHQTNQESTVAKLGASRSSM